MRLPETREYLVKELEFPVSVEDAVESIGELCIETPLGGEEQLSSTLERCGEREFQSADELYDSIVGSVGSEHVGRQKYDDRGPSLGDDEEVSF